MRTLVTGGSGGIGRLVVKACRSLNWKVSSPSRKELDMEDEGSVGRFILENEPPELAIFCHGTWYSKAADLRSTRDWCDQYQSRVVFPSIMIDYWLDSGELRAVTLVSSTRGFMGGMDTGPYAMACAAQIALVLGYARETPDCQFNVVCPGLTDTDMGKDVVATGGAAPDAVPQPVEAVVGAILDTVISGGTGWVLRVVNGEVSTAEWEWKDPHVYHI